MTDHHDPAPPQIQLTGAGELKHFLSLEGLDRALLTRILDTADSFIEVGERTIKKYRCCAGAPW